MPTKWIITSSVFLITLAAALVAVDMMTFHTGQGLLEERPNAASGGLADKREEALLKTLKSLDQRLCELNLLMAQRGDDPDLKRERIVPLDAPFPMEELVSKLKKVISNPILSIERNASLRENLDRMGGTDPGCLKNRYQTEKMAQRSLFMMTYTQVLKDLGPPEEIYGSKGLKVLWNYPDGTIYFVDGYVSMVDAYELRSE